MLQLMELPAPWVRTVNEIFNCVSYKMARSYH